MHVKLLIVALCLCVYSTLALVHHGWLDFFLNQIKSLEPHEVLFLDHDTTREYSKERDVIIRTVSQEVPVMILRVPDIMDKNTPIQKENQSLFASITKHKTLVIILAMLGNDTIHQAIDFLTTMTYNMRPNTLLVCLNPIAETDTSSSEIITSILNYAWSKRFLDFTILTKDTSAGDPESMATMYSLNPFHGSANIESLDSSSSLIFPNKLGNLNGFPVTFPFSHLPPFSMMKLHKNGSLEIDGPFYPPTNFILTEMNFTKTVRTTTDHSSMDKMIESLNQDILNGKVDMVITPGPLRLTVAGLLIDTETDSEKIIAVVPVLFEKSFNVPSAIFLHACIVTLIILTIISIKYFIVMAGIQWPSLHVFALILGVSVNVETRKLCSKIIYLSIAFMSIVYSNELFSTILSINVSQIQVPFETYEDIDTSQLPIVCSDIDYSSIFPDSESVTDPHLKNIMHKIIRITGHPEDLKRCVDDLGNGAQHICIMASWLAKVFMADHILKAGAPFPKMKLAKPVFSRDRFNTIFEPSSPYAERFLEIQRRMYEGGDLYKLKFSKQSFVETNDIEKDSFDADISTPKELLFILSIGYIMSIIIILTEFLWQKYKNRRNN